MNKAYTVYVLQSKKTEKFYVGQTQDLEKRLKQHNEEESLSTKSGIPWLVVYKETGLKSRSAAMLREKELKRMKGGIQFKALVNNARIV